ncbi:MAG: hypothetical protein AAFX93_00290 [Verrucomicrobiota bacterium]
MRKTENSPAKRPATMKAKQASAVIAEPSPLEQLLYCSIILVAATPFAIIGLGRLINAWF